MKKWYEGKNAVEILEVMSRLSHEAVVCTKRKEWEVSEKLQQEFTDKFNEVMPCIVDVKTEYWAYRDKNDVYSTWEKLQSDLWECKNYMENEITIYIIQNTDRLPH